MTSLGSVAVNPFPLCASTSCNGHGMGIPLQGLPESLDAVSILFSQDPRRSRKRCILPLRSTRGKSIVPHRIHGAPASRSRISCRYKSHLFSLYCNPPWIPPFSQEALGLSSWIRIQVKPLKSTPTGCSSSEANPDPVMTCRPPCCSRSPVNPEKPTSPSTR